VQLSVATLFGVDFTSAPSRRKAITIARSRLADNLLSVDTIDAITSFSGFEQFLATPGSWLGAFDFPFGLPRELVVTLGWPDHWPELIEHVAALPRAMFADALNGVRESRPIGNRYIARRGDGAAGSSSPMKLVNPPVGLMFYEGAQRLLRAGISVVPCAANGDTRVAVEAYPGYLARQLTSASYKKDGPEGRSPARRQARQTIIDALTRGVAATAGLRVDWPRTVREQCLDDGSGDCLDAVLCAIQAAIAQRRADAGDPRFGIPAEADPLEGWIATVSAP
jgi:hypothetical protein